ncbi:hypothetical protein NMY22_g8811 [Coprinellus aureogranulatus]|nr:hypothetical protein NMY22_g8811 [Coprinellus aureogranulatus]
MSLRGVHTHCVKRAGSRNVVPPEVLMKLFVVMGVRRDPSLGCGHESGNDGQGAREASDVEGTSDDDAQWELENRQRGVRSDKTVRRRRAPVTLPLLNRTRNHVRVGTLVALGTHGPQSADIPTLMSAQCAFVSVALDCAFAMELPTHFMLSSVADSQALKASENEFPY